MPGGNITSFVSNPAVCAYKKYFMYVAGVTSLGYWKAIYYNNVNDVWYDTHTELEHKLIDMAMSSNTIDNTEDLYLGGGRFYNATGAITWAPTDVININFLTEPVTTSQTNIKFDSREYLHILYRTITGLYYAYSKRNTFNMDWVTEIIAEEGNKIGEYANGEEVIYYKPSF